ncbi:hypothetical protein [Pseudidiomarina sediminum]|uniref:hypothetical protein n=1 Tax=Pseudidiomarina sediminum TaxID=431675 RepID=UPI001C97B4C1|nr:hypothetical protein [Pseudidiomarina sediminum]MBY6063704.1 hypothetical protein [Pseudidiomarina sediminum]
MTRLLKVFVLTVVLWLSASVSAEPYKVQLIGDVQSSHPLDYPHLFEDIATVEVTLVFDRSVYPTPITGGYDLQHGLQQMEIKFFDDSGQPVAGNPLLPEIDDLLGSSQTSYEPLDPPGNDLRITYQVLTPSKGNHVQFFLFETANYQLFETLSETDYRMATFENEGGILKGVFVVFSIIDSVNFDVHTLREIIKDADGDGVADADDQCLATVESDTVWFDGVNSGVTNHVDANGCAISDHYASCDAEAQSSGLLGYSGPTQCEMMMGYQLYRDGLIDYTELRMLRNVL